jgi:hypothetical protein
MKNFRLVVFAFLFSIFALIALPVFALAADLPAQDFLAQVFEAVKGLGGLSWMGKIASIMLLIVASMKVSFLRPLWDKLGPAKAILAPVLGLIAGCIAMPSLSLQGLMAYLFAGAGAIVLHELLDALKSVPGLGGLYVGVIDFVMKLLGGAQAEAQALK